MHSDPVGSTADDAGVERLPRRLLEFSQFLLGAVVSAAMVTIVTEDYRWWVVFGGALPAGVAAIGGYLLGHHVDKDSRLARHAPTALLGLACVVGAVARIPGAKVPAVLVAAGLVAAAALVAPDIAGAGRLLTAAAAIGAAAALAHAGLEALRGDGLVSGVGLGLGASALAAEGLALVISRAALSRWATLWAGAAAGILGVAGLRGGLAAVGTASVAAGVALVVLGIAALADRPVLVRVAAVGAEVALVGEVVALLGGGELLVGGVIVGAGAAMAGLAFATRHGEPVLVDVVLVAGGVAAAVAGVALFGQGAAPTGAASMIAGMAGAVTGLGRMWKNERLRARARQWVEWLTRAPGPAEAPGLVPEGTPAAGDRPGGPGGRPSPVYRFPDPLDVVVPELAVATTQRHALPPILPMCIAACVMGVGGTAAMHAYSDGRSHGSVMASLNVTPQLLGVNATATDVRRVSGTAQYTVEPATVNGNAATRVHVTIANTNVHPQVDYSSDGVLHCVGGLDRDPYRPDGKLSWAAELGQTVDPAEQRVTRVHLLDQESDAGNPAARPRISLTATRSVSDVASTRTADRCMLTARYRTELDFTLPARALSPGTYFFVDIWPLTWTRIEGGSPPVARTPESVDARILTQLPTITIR